MTDEAVRDRASSGTLNRAPSGQPGGGAASGDGETGIEPFEVFRQEKEGGPMVHGGSVVAPDALLALHYAREMFSRRGESVRLWVVRRVDVHELADLDILAPPLDRSYRKPGGYVMRDKLAAARERAGTSKPQASAGGRDSTGRKGSKP